MVLTIPKAHAQSLGLTEGARIGVTIEDGKLVGDPAVRARPQYRLAELLAECDPTAPLSDEDRAWLADEPVGDEAI